MEEPKINRENNFLRRLAQLVQTGSHRPPLLEKTEVKASVFYYIFSVDSISQHLNRYCTGPPRKSLNSISIILATQTTSATTNVLPPT